MNEVLQRIEQLKEAKGITVYRLMKDLNMSQSTYSTWIEKDRVPKTDRLQVIAEYFNVSVDYLLNGTNEPEPIDVGVEIQKLINYLTDDNSSYCYGEVLSEEGKLALLNSLKQDKEFLTALTNTKK